MASKAYNRGSAFERRVKRELEDVGYYVMKSGGSKGPADIIAIDTTGTAFLIQCKKDGKLSKKEWEDLVKLGLQFHSSTLHVSKPKRNEPIRFEYLHYAGKDIDDRNLSWAHTE